MLSKGIAIFYHVSSIINMDALRNLYCTIFYFYIFIFLFIMLYIYILPYLIIIIIILNNNICHIVQWFVEIHILLI